MAKPIEAVDTRVQETATAWYRGAKVVEFYTTNTTDMTLFERKGWPRETGPKAKAAEPYVIYRVPRNAISIRTNKPKVKRTRKPLSPEHKAKLLAGRRRSRFSPKPEVKK